MFEDDDNLEDVLNKPHIRDTKFLAWMGPTSYDEIKTVKDIKYNSFKEACFALGLFEDDTEFIDAINQASFWGTADFMRKLFFTLLVTNQFAQPEVVWSNTWQNLSDDIVYCKRRILRVPGICFFCYQ